MATYYDVLGLPARYHVSARELEEHYHAAAREHHPDRHVRDGEARRVSSALRTAELTEAYRTLRDPVKRAEYLIGLAGIRITDEKSGHKVDPAFLMEILELREELADARAAHDEVTIERLANDLRARRKNAIADIDRAFTAYDAGDRDVLAAIADRLVALRYFARFLDEVEAHEEARAEASDAAT